MTKVTNDNSQMDNNRTLPVYSTYFSLRVKKHLLQSVQLMKAEDTTAADFVP